MNLLSCGKGTASWEMQLDSYKRQTIVSYVPPTYEKPLGHVRH